MDSLASEASGPTFRPSLTKGYIDRVSSEFIKKSAKSSGSEGSSGGAAQALLQQSDCVESASEQVGVLGALSKSKSGSKTGSKSLKSLSRPGGQTVWP